jgi:serine/threonine protein kinase/Flp pilus assembly protein TadD
MSEPTPDPSPAPATSDEELLGQLADDFAMRRRRGEHPTVDEYVAKHPPLAERIRKVFSAVGMIEQTVPLDFTAGERPGSTIGRYKLLERIGEGGFGVVYMAEQVTPVRRKVALKVLKPGMDSRQVLARFEAERQALAIMDHPNIARVFDAGATDAGRPYFVMELVKGVPITEFCDQQQLTPRARLELFAQVCHAVQHAHQKGIIHRDIKPSNVLVMMHDTKPVVKVIDFGVAKALGQELTERTLFTGFAQLVGTPLYMSPEQAGQSALDVDTRSDIYSLGVLLYELLTGTTPFDKERFKKAAQDEIRRIIREEEPPKPSTRLSASGGTLASISAQRHTEPAKLTKLVRGELDWIVMKALEKDRARRYETANGLAADVQRYLADEQVLACPPSAAYRFRKFARRNRPALLATSAVFTVLLLLVAGLTVSNVRVARERNQTAAVLKQKEQVLAAVKANWVNLGGTYLSQGKIDEAVAAYRQAIELDMDPASAYSGLGNILQGQKKFDEAAVAYRKAIELDPKCAAGPYNGLGNALGSQERFDDAISCYRKAIELDPKQDGAYVNLGEVLRHQKKFDEAAAAFRKAIELDPKDGTRYGHIGSPRSVSPQVAGYLRLGRLLQQQKNLDEAVGVWRKLIELDPKLVAAHSGLGSALLDQNRPEEAVAAFKQALTIDPQSAKGHNDVAWLLATHPNARLRDPGMAHAMAKKAVELDPKNGAYLNTLGVACYRMGDFARAAATLQKFRELRTDDEEWSNPFFLAMAQWQLGHKDEARRWFDTGVAWMNKTGKTSETTLRVRGEAAELLSVEAKNEPTPATAPATTQSQPPEK